MQTLELKHLAAYLPYKVSVARKNINKKPIHAIHHMLGIGSVNHMLDSDIYKIVLRPLSDLTKVIEHNGKSFVPIREIYFPVLDENFRYEKYVSPGTNRITIRVKYRLGNDTFEDIVLLGGTVSQTQYNIVQLLLEWHFDIFNLIPSGLAIDINTLNT